MCALVAASLALTSGVASAQDYSGYRVIDTTALDLIAGPAGTAALLSPDGDRLLHIGISDICLLTPSRTGIWTQADCIPRPRDMSLVRPEDMLWSPSGGQLVMPTFGFGALLLQDTDIRVLDTQAMTVTNLTDDGYDGGLIETSAPIDFDLAARWLDDETMIFLRYSVDATGAGGPASLMLIDVTSGETAPLETLAGSGQFPVQVLAMSAYDGRFAYSYDNPVDPDAAGIYVLETGIAPQRIIAMSDIGRPPFGLTFSADGRFLLLFLGLDETMLGKDIKVLDLATGEIMPVDAARNVWGAAWSPTGSALAYVTSDGVDGSRKSGGFFIADQPGAPGRQLLKGELVPPVCCGDLPFIWAANDTMVLVLRDSNEHDEDDTLLFVELGK